MLCILLYLVRALKKNSDIYDFQLAFKLVPDKHEVIIWVFVYIFKLKTFVTVILLCNISKKVLDNL